MADIDELRSRYVALNGTCPASVQLLDDIESELQVDLPAEFRQVCKFFDGGGIDVIPLFSLAGNAPRLNPLHETLRLRAAVRLPSNLLVLAEPPESLILMNCSDGGRVLWIDAIDVERIATEQFSRDPESWVSFSDFFSHLLDEEEAERN